MHTLRSAHAVRVFKILWNSLLTVTWQCCSVWGVELERLAFCLMWSGCSCRKTLSFIHPDTLVTVEICWLLLIFIAICLLFVASRSSMCTEMSSAYLFTHNLWLLMSSEPKVQLKGIHVLILGMNNNKILLLNLNIFGNSCYFFYCSINKMSLCLSPVSADMFLSMGEIILVMAFKEGNPLNFIQFKSWKDRKRELRGH